MSVQDIPLLELFLRLQKVGLPLGIDEYLRVLSALQAGFGITDVGALQRLCHTLWVKSADERRLFDYHFEQLLSLAFETETVSQPMEASSLPDELPSPTIPLRLEAPSLSGITVQMEDEVEVAQAVQALGTEDGAPSSLYSTLADEYFPATQRQMKQRWRYLRRPIRTGPAVKLDIEATVHEVGRTGLVLEPVLVPARKNVAELILLIDHSGSMIPFHTLAHRLVETLVHGGYLGKITVYYFHNCPTDYLYRDTADQEYERIEDILKGRYLWWTGVLLFSDAGAARGGFNPRRIEATEKFLKQFKKRFRYIAWLNPVPRSRWPGTTAKMVRRSVPMFDLSLQGLDNAIDVLRGRPLEEEEDSSKYAYHG